MDYEIVDFDKRELLGLEVDVNPKFSDEGGIANFWMGFMENIDFSQYTESFGISRNWNAETKEFIYAIAMNEKSLHNKADLKSYVISEGKYAKFKYVGILENKKMEKFFEGAFSAVFDKINEDIIKNYNCFEYYTHEYKGPDHPDSIFYLMIPVK